MESVFAFYSTRSQGNFGAVESVFAIYSTRLLCYIGAVESIFAIYSTGVIMESAFIGRKAELKILTRLANKRSASLVVIRGRRRIGKSRLIEEFAKKIYFL